MVQILPPKTDVGSAIGAGLGQGLGQGIARGGEIGFQRNLIQNAMKGLENLPKNANAFQLASQLIQATAGIPGAERYVGQLYPLLLTQMQSRNLPQGEATSRGGLPEQQGYLSNAPLTQGQKVQFAQELTKQGVPLAQGIELANQVSAGSEKALQHIESNLKAQGIGGSEMPYAMQMAQLQKSNDPNQVTKEVMKGIDELRSLERGRPPGYPTVAAKVLGGPIARILSGRETRDQAISRARPVVERLIEKGYDPIVRAKLSEMGFSPTEIQEMVNPFSKEAAKLINAFPKASNDAQKNEQSISEYLLKNLKPNDSLLLLRRKLSKDKGYDWRQVNEGFRMARENGLQLSPEQDRELGEFATPPRDSLLDIFYNAGRPFGFLMGEK